MKSLIVESGAWTEKPVAANPDWLQWTCELKQWDFIAWLLGQQQQAHFYWADREGRERLCGVGCAWEGTRPEQVPAGLRGFCALRFDAGCGPLGAEWQDWGKGHCFVPRILAEDLGDRVRLTLTQRQKETIKLEPLLQYGVAAAWPAALQVQRRPEFARWAEQVQAVLDAPYDKLVLARIVDVCFDSAVAPAQLLERLMAKAAGCYHFLFSPRGATAFIGCSPERLFSVSDGVLLTEAVAGTRPSGEQEGRELLASEKDRREQRIVVDRICKQLKPYAKRLIYEQEPGLLQKRFWQHLWTPIRAELASATLSELISALHPTPAVGGEPREGAEASIREIEGFDRGLYAGALGWVDGDNAEFCVGIRSGLLQGQRLSLYTGCGIVEGSTAESEWEETECKTQNFIQVLQ